jgi:GNAT superfamily N-acetyltransferase
MRGRGRRSIHAQPASASPAACAITSRGWPPPPTASASADAARYALNQRSAAALGPRKIAFTLVCKRSMSLTTLAGASVEIMPVESSRDLRRFVDLPWKIYNAADHPQWVPPLRIAVRDALDTKANPFYRQADRQLFLAFRGGRPVGRIAAIENRAHNQFHDDRIGFFGFFESANDQNVADALFTAAETWLRGRGLDTMRGPMNPSTNHECGMLVDGYQQHPMIMTTWNPPYYPTLVESAGFAKAKDLLAYYFPREGNRIFELPDRYRAHAERALRGDRLTFRDLDLKNFDREVERCWQIYNSAWEDNWGFFPMSHDSFLHEAKVLKYIIWPEFAFIAEVNGEPAGFMIIVPDFHHAYKAVGDGRLLPTGLFKLLGAKKRLRSGRIMILGAKAEYRRRGIFALFAHEMFERAKTHNLSGAEASWILEDNEKLNRPMKALGAEEYRRWRIYDRPIEGVGAQ